MSDTGHKKELSDATTHLADAIASADPDALRKAAGDHATALNSQATAMAASIAEPVYTKLGEVVKQIKDLAMIVTNARQADLSWRTEERSTRDAQSTRLYAELDKLIAASEESARGQKKLWERIDEVIARITADELRLDSKRLRIEVLEADVAALRIRIDDDVARRLAALEARADG